ncbi:MAG: hypothetical protein N2316_06010 [Spirochaetes bacterium]|nr:hypothetical protein [Spirochaetota bacterium]
MKKRLVVIIFIIAILKNFQVYAQSISHALGENITVSPAGAGDVWRNPALLSFEKEKVGTVAFAEALLSNIPDISAHANVKSPNLAIENRSFNVYESEKKLIGGGGAFFFQYQKSSIGVGITGTSMNKDSSFDLLLYVPAYSANILFRNDQFEYRGAMRGYLSASWRIFENFSLGAQWIYEYRKDFTDENNEGYTNSIKGSWEYKSISKTSYISSGCIGVMMASELFQLGIVLVTPDVTYSKSDYENKRDDLLNVAYSYAIARSIENPWQNTTGFGAIFGLAVNFSPHFAIVGEFGFRRDGSYSETILVVHNLDYEEVNEIYKFQTLFVFSAGMKYFLDNSLSIACGAFSQRTSLEAEYNASSSARSLTTSYKLYGARFGFEKRLTQMASLIVIAVVDRNEFDLGYAINETNMAMVIQENIVEYECSINVAIRLFL